MQIEKAQTEKAQPVEINQEFNGISKQHSKKERKNQEIKYIVLHYSAIPGISAKKLAKRFANTKNEKSIHFCVDEKEIYQVVPLKYAAWHCGQKNGKPYAHKTARNANAIGVELCEDKICCDTQLITDLDWYFTPETLELAARLVAELMQRFEIPIENVIRHYDVTGKICPTPFVGSIISPITHNTHQQDFEAFLDSCKKAREKLK